MHIHLCSMKFHEWNSNFSNFIGNLCNEELTDAMRSLMILFQFGELEHKFPAPTNSKFGSDLCWQRFVTLQKAKLKIYNRRGAQLQSSFPYHSTYFVTSIQALFCLWNFDEQWWMWPNLIFHQLPLQYDSYFYCHFLLSLQYRFSLFSTQFLLSWAKEMMVIGLTDEGQISKQSSQEVHDVHDRNGDVGDVLHLCLCGAVIRKI